MSDNLKQNRLPRIKRQVPGDANRPIDKSIPVEQLSGPAEAMREGMDEEKMQDLIASIQEVGLINPLAVVPRGDGFEVKAGHRRLIACISLGWRAIPCRVYPAGCQIDEAIKAHENAFREDLNPAEEARYFGRMLATACENDVDKLVAMMHLTRDYVEGRLLLLAGDEDVLQALAASKISYGVAQWLNKCKDRLTRITYLQAAVDGGASVRLVRDWVTRANTLQELQENAPPNPSADVPRTGSASTPPLLCALCEEGPEAGGIECYFVHRHCKRLLIDKPLEDMRRAAERSAAG